MYKVVVIKMPQAASSSDAINAGIYANILKRTLTYSSDDMLRLMQNPYADKERSYVEILNPSMPSQVEAIEVLERNGFEWQEITFSDLVSLDLGIVYSQNNPQWRDKPLGDGSVPNKTIGNWGCLGTAYSSMAVYMGLCDDNPAQFNDRMVRTGAMSGIYVQPAALRTTFPDDIVYHGWFTTDIYNRVKAQIEKGIPIPARVDMDETAGYTEHWILITGYTSDGDLELANSWPFPSDVDFQSNTIFDRIHEVLIYDYKEDAPEPPSTTIDIAPYFSREGNSQLFELETRVNGVSQGQERVQLKMYGDGISHITKNMLYEELKVTNTHIQRSIDTSMNAHQFYYLTNTNSDMFVNWMKRHMSLGEQFISRPIVITVDKASCNQLSANSTVDYLTLRRHLNSFTCYNGVIISDVIEVEWRKSPDGDIEETYYFAKGMGLVGWGTADGTGRVARVSELHDVGQRPDNEEIYYCG